MGAQYRLLLRSLQRYNGRLMSRHTQKITLRLLLLVMLASFLSPSFGLGLVASHAQLAHMTVGVDADHEHGQPGPQHDTQEHKDAHSSIGHLLTHLSVGLFEMPRLGFSPQVQTYFPEQDSLVLHRVTQPPFRPPRAFLPL